jgi:Bacterial SH3 domain
MGRYAAAVAVLAVMGTAPVHAQDAQFSVATAAANIHKAPSTGSAVIGKVPRGTTFEIVRELGSWVSVSWPQGDNGVAYIHVAWGQISRGAAVQASRTTTAPEPSAAPRARAQLTAARPPSESEVLPPAASQVV